MRDELSNRAGTAVAAALVFAMVFASGCRTLEPPATHQSPTHQPPTHQAHPQEIPADLAVGDAVVVELNSGDRREFTIRALERDAIVSRDERIAYKDVRRIERATARASAPSDETRSALFETAATALAVLAIAAVEVASQIYGSDDAEIYDVGEVEPDPTVACRDFGVCQKR
jgi:hypothetical protein